MLVTDWAEISDLYVFHQVADSPQEAVRMAIGNTSIDMSMVADVNSEDKVEFFDDLLNLVKTGVKTELPRVQSGFCN